MQVLMVGRRLALMVLCVVADADAAFVAARRLLEVWTRPERIESNC